MTSPRSGPSGALASPAPVATPSTNSARASVADTSGDQPSSVRARLVSSRGEWSSRSTHSGWVRCRCSRHVAATAPRTALEGTGRARAPSAAETVPASRGGSAARLNEPRASETRAQRAAVQPVGLGPDLSPDDQRRAEAHHPHLGVGELEGVEDALDVRLLLRVGRGGNAMRGPRLVDGPPAGVARTQWPRSRRVGPERRGDDQRSHPGRRRGLEDPEAAPDVGPGEDGRPVVRLHPPHQVHHRVGGGQRVREVVPHHVGGPPRHLGDLESRAPPGQPHDGVDPRLVGQGPDHAGAHVARGPVTTTLTAPRPAGGRRCPRVRCR